jgi:hypothetical protein
MEVADLLLRAGGIGVLAFVVVAFLKTIREFIKVISEVSQKCHANQDRSTAAVIANTAALSEVVESSRSGIAVMEEVKTLLIRVERNGVRS